MEVGDRKDSFKSEVASWRITAIVISSTIAYFVLGCILSKAGLAKKGMHLLCIILMAVLVIGYRATLKSVPVTFSVLTAGEVLLKLAWSVIHFVFVLTEISAFSVHLSADTMKLMAFLITTIFTYTDNNVLLFKFKKTGRFSELWGALKVTRRFTLFVCVMILAVVLGLVNRNGEATRIFLLCFLVSDILHTLTAVISSENVSFETKRGERLVNGLGSRDEFWKWMAFRNLFDMSCGGQGSREFLFDGRITDTFEKVVKKCHVVLESYGNRHLCLTDQGMSSIPLHRVNDSQWRRTQVDRPRAHSNDSNAGFISRLLTWFKKDRKQSLKKSKILVDERRALEQSTTVMYAIRALVNFMIVMEKEDRLGVGAREAQNIVNDLIFINNALSKTEHYRWATSDFSQGWFVKSPLQLTHEVLRTVQNGLTELRRMFAGKLDFSRMN